MFTPMQRSTGTNAPPDRSEIPQRDAYPVPEVAALLGGVTPRYVWKLIDSGELPSFKVGARRLVARTDLDAYIARLRADEQRAREAAASA
jgi:excisionase family DNA binding protein